jgi:hypothetical protein
MDSNHPSEYEKNKNDDYHQKNTNEKPNNKKDLLVSKVRELYNKIKANPFPPKVQFCIFMSTLFLLVLLLGSFKSVYLSSFIFDDKVRALTGKNELSFTLYGYCVDDKCSASSLFNGFDKGKIILIL